jgi:hypothetical protein
VVDGRLGVPVERQQATRDRSEVSTIKDLIRAALANGKTVRQLEADSGGRVRFQTFQELSNAAPKNFPRDVHDTITGMAIALGVPEATIVLAYAKSLGVPVSTGSAFAMRVPPGVDRLDPAVQDAALGLLRAVVRMEVTSQSPASPEVDEIEEDEIPLADPDEPPLLLRGDEDGSAAEDGANESV